ncbi:MAG: ABC transporter substrate-binding protein [Chitinophagaceae bacterium]|nr:amino acid ABC transporter substrate-binding protein [Chitinophagaceae bacterium]
MKKFHLFFLLLMTGSAVFAQQTLLQTPLQKHRIAVFAPLFLDSAFNNVNEYRYAKTEFPKFINPGLEFVEGVQLALDTFNIEKAPLEIYIYDTRSANVSLNEQLAKAARDSVELILAYCKGSEVRAFADSGLKNMIPVINVNFPNGGGTEGNPYFVLLNPTIQTQLESIYRYIQKYYPLEQLIVFRTKGKFEDQIKMYFDNFSQSTVGIPLDLKYVTLPDNFTEQDLAKHLDTVKHSLCIAGSLDVNFGEQLTQQLASLKKQNYVVSVMGMPTWDGIDDFKDADYQGIDIVYSTPFYNPRTDKISQKIIDYFNRNMYARPSDMVMRGYEAMWRFANILMKFKTDFASNLSFKDFDVFREFDIQPVLDRETMMLNYFENKKLYFLTLQNGIIKEVH